MKAIDIYNWKALQSDQNIVCKIEQTGGKLPSFPKSTTTFPFFIACCNSDIGSWGGCFVMPASGKKVASRGKKRVSFQSYMCNSAEITQILFRPPTPEKIEFLYNEMLDIIGMQSLQEETLYLTNRFVQKALPIAETRCVAHQAFAIDLLSQLKFLSKNCMGFSSFIFTGNDQDFYTFKQYFPIKNVMRFQDLSTQEQMYSVKIDLKRANTTDALMLDALPHCLAHQRCSDVGYVDQSAFIY